MYLRYSKQKIGDIDFSELIAEDRPAEVADG